MHYDGAVPANATPLLYRVPLAGDLPARYEGFVVEHGGPGPYGAKALGESGMLGVAAAIANAIEEAAAGTSRRVWHGSCLAIRSSRRTSVRRVVEMQRVAVSELSAEGFASFGMVGLPLADTNTADYTICGLAAPMAFAP